jgi:uncharacterized protein YigE (DUF2233 family)
LAFLLPAAAEETKSPDFPVADLVHEPDLAAVLAAAKAAPLVTLVAGVSYRNVELPDFGTTIHVWTFDRSRYSVSLAEQQAPTGSLVRNLIGTATFAINAGFFERDKETHALSPSGLLIIGGREVAAENDRAGSGILYSNADGVFVGYRRNLRDHSTMTNAVQVGPILVDPGGKVSVVNRNNKRAQRSVFCLRAGTFAAINVQGGGLSLFQIASLLAAPVDQGGFGCDVALNLDGGPSAQAVFQAADQRIEAGGSPVQNALLVMPRR